MTTESSTNDQNRGARSPFDLLTRKETAELLRISDGTLHNWRYRNFGPPATKIGGQVLWVRKDVEAWIDQQRQGQPDNPTAGRGA